MFGMCLGCERMCVFCVCTMHTDARGLSGSLERVRTTKKRAFKAPLHSEEPSGKCAFIFPGLCKPQKCKFILY